MSVILSRHRGMPAQDGAGVKLTRVVNQPNLGYQDPFLMLDEFRSDDANDYIAGFPAHPHRGFVTLTYMLAGQMEHKDSVGNTGLVSGGGAQWMKAARGIIHAEMPHQTDGLMWGFQIWINLPAEDKMADAEWADYPAQQIPEWQSENVTVRVVAGDLSVDKEAFKGPVQQPKQQLQILDVRFAGQGQFRYSGLEQATRMAYIYQGNVSINQQQVSRGELVRLEPHAELLFSATEDAGLLLLSGRPIGEPIAQYGPFVMNTESEIEQAIRDYQNGTLTD
ncbi:Quercetin 2,3-dioxygenase [Pseudidiomarina piscicola]|uniref:Quercetin 2,3-dioxygenase n=1 Tax=Pseudidiomarina piscicola TaxID=2614830 RepID=A0A6S6WLK4_9GAMM|nr:pirin family protein [Pseudidiomarina piscicola]CAB0149828.1 Quercetin 2,3-dioxygenase [Pseudidiomarina piscicola]VZT39274.1 Quercetin 2,3-dioxygenase [Pseudomonas aeruginosa]